MTKNDSVAESKPATRIARTIAGGSNVGGAVYGTVIAIAVLGAWNADKTSEAVETLVGLIATMLVFWIAHAYAHIVAEGLASSSPTHKNTASALAHDWPIVQAGVLPAIILGLGAMGVIGDRLSLHAALASAVLSLFAYGFIMARSGARSWLASALIALGLGCLGLIIAVLEVKIG